MAVGEQNGQQDAYCGARKKNGEHCRSPAGWGTEHLGFGTCKLHGGRTPGAVKHAQKARAERAVQRLGLVPEGRIDPRDALATELWQLHCRAQSIELLIAELELSADAAGGLAAGTFHATGERTGERVEHPYWRMRMEVSKRIREVASECHRCGVEDRQIQLTADRSAMIGVLIRAIVERFLSGSEREAALKFAAGELRQLGSG